MHPTRRLTPSPASNFRTTRRFFALCRVVCFRIGFFALTLWIFLILFFGFGVRFTWSSSLPPGLYRTVDEPIQRGVLVAVCLPETIATTTRKRGYGHPGFCPGGIAPILKKVAAMPGDTVQVNAMGMSVNDLPIPRTARRKRDSEGRTIPMIEEGIYTVDAGELWLISNYRSRSWDSRYFGPIPMDSIQSVMKPWLVWN